MLVLQRLERPVRPEVHAAVARLVADVARLGGAVGWLEVPPPEQVRVWLDGLLHLVAAGDARVLLAHEDGVDGDLLGLGAWVRQPAAVHRHNAEVRKVMTAPQARGRGVARQVVQALVTDAQESGLELLTLSARGNNHAALGLYLDLGFAVTGRLPDAVAVGAERFDEVLLHLDLRVSRSGDDGLVRHGSRREGVGCT